MVDKTTIDEYEKIRREYEEKLKQYQLMQQQIVNQFKSDLRPKIEELVTLYKQRQDEDRHIKTLQEELKKARENYAYLSQKFMTAYNSILNTANLLPDSEKLVMDTIFSIAPELRNAISETTKAVARSVSKFLSSQARYIDPFTGETYISWADAVRDKLIPKPREGEELTLAQKQQADTIMDKLSNTSAHKIFRDTLGYELLTLNNETIEEVNDCLETPGCRDNLYNAVEKAKPYLTENEIIDIISDYLKTHPKEQI